MTEDPKKYSIVSVDGVGQTMVDMGGKVQLILDTILRERERRATWHVR